MNTIRTRIAPSPTGYPHIGTIYQALFNLTYAHKYDGHFIVRIEDTDRTRFVEGAEDVIFSTLDWFGLTEDESPRKDGPHGPYRQSERLRLYHKYVQELIDKDKAFFAFYKKAEAGEKKDYSHKETPEVSVSENITQQEAPKSVAEMPENGDWVVRMRVPRDHDISFQDEIRGEITFPANQVSEQVILKSDKFPTYHLAVVVDDHLMGITHVVRGEEWISSTPKHVLLYNYFGWELPKFYHTPDLRNPDKSKLSKRHGHTDVRWYQAEGYLPEAIRNFLALQGWTHPEEKEIFSQEEFAKLFDLKDIRAVAPIFDLTKLTWMNGEYIRMMKNDELKDKLIEFYKNDETLNNYLKNNPMVDQVLELAKTRIKTLKEFKDLIKFLIEPPDKSLLNEEHISIAPKVLQALEQVPEFSWNKDTIFNSLKGIMDEARSIKMPVFYVLFTGNKRGLPLPETLEILGRQETLERLDQIVK